MNIHELQRGLAALVTSVLILFAASTAYAVPLTLGFSGSGSGTLGGVAFGPSDFVITATTDTDDVIQDSNPFPGIFVDILPHSSASISIDGLGSFDFVGGTESFFNDNATYFDGAMVPSTNIIGFRSTEGAGSDLYNIASSDFEGWDAQSAISSASAQGSLLQWNLVNVLVTDGIDDFALQFTSQGTFAELSISVTPVPLPAALPLLASVLGLAGFVGWRRRRLTLKSAHQH